MNREKDSLYSIGAFAKLTGVTERTLRFYDRKSLLKPSSKNEHGYRYYTEKDLLQLQKILTLKYLDFSLDDIAVYLGHTETNLQQSLAEQYKLLERKKQHLERVLETIDRMQKISEGAGKMDTDLLLLFIHNIQHEEHQKQWLSAQIPPSMVEAIFMDGMAGESRLEVEKQLTACLLRLREHYKRGKQPLDPEVQDSGRELVAMLGSLIGPAVNGLSEQERSQLTLFDDPNAAIDPVLFPNMFSKEEEAFLNQVFAHLEASEAIIGGNVNE